MLFFKKKFLINLISTKYPVIYGKYCEFKSSPIRVRFAKGAYWGIYSWSVPKVVTLLSSFYLARILGKNTFGEYGVINGTVSMVSSFAGLGIGTTVTKYIAELKVYDPIRLGKIVSLSSIINFLSAILYSIIFLVFSPWLAKNILAAPQLAPILQISTICLALGTINSIQQSVLVGFEAFRYNSLISIISSIFQSFLLVLGAYYYGLTGVVLAFTISAFFLTVLYGIATYRERKKFHVVISLRGAKDEYGIIFRYTIPAFLAGVLVGPAFWATNAILANQTNGYSELGILSAASQWQQIIQLIPSIIGAALLPVMSEKYGLGDKEGSIRIMKRMTKIITIIVVPVAVLLSFLSTFIMSCYGRAFSSGYLTLVFVIITSAFLAILTPISQFISASGKMWSGFFLNLIWVFCLLILSYILVKWGALGIALARFMSYLILGLCTYFFVRKLAN